MILDSVVKDLPNVDSIVFRRLGYESRLRRMQSASTSDILARGSNSIDFEENIITEIAKI
jgi:hypothetical protein